MTTSKISLALVIAGLLGLSAACSKKEKAGLEGTVTIDGSSTVYPITEAVAEEFNKKFPQIRVTVGVSGTGGGFKKFTKGETDINDASRPIKAKEVEIAKERGVDYIEIPVAYDGISIVVNPNNTWAKDFTAEELHAMWKPGSQVKTWRDIRSSWPNEKIKFYGPGPDSGTFDYFTEAINHKSGRSRDDYTKSEDDNVLVMGVKGDLYSIGYFGFAYYQENKKSIRAVPIHNGKKPVAPTFASINDGSYRPLSRPVFIYVSTTALKRPEVREFVDFYLKEASNLVSQVGYVSLPAAKYQESLAKIEKLLGKDVAKR